MIPDNLKRIEDQILDATAEHFGRDDFSESYAKLARAIINAMLAYSYATDDTRNLRAFETVE